ncbi:DUF6602 domain-containing protein [uncultured Dokdonia sp.]|uniref:DUF6602 domain-containing protein n=1 Tax=uncultured Dokdonia sp. TaxID=575653 RepID=UPI0026311F5D|nr:DUF6602 domain-containing protein [uncultured Dokdonia sp.]
MMNEKGKRVREFFEIEAKSIYQRYKSIEKLLPKGDTKGSAHSSEEGRFVESLIRDFLNKHLPKNLEALSGFILKPSTKTGMSDLERVENEYDEHSSQIDIIVYDTAQFPIYERFEEFCVVPPDGVIAIISVKKTLRYRDIEPELESLSKNAKLCKINNNRIPFLCLLSFTYDFGKSKNYKTTIFKKIKKKYEKKDFELMINELTILDLCMFFKFRKEDSDKDENAKYVLIDLENKFHIGIQRLLQSILGVYYNKSINSNIERPGYVSFEKGTFGGATTIGYIKY